MQRCVGVLVLIAALALVFARPAIAQTGDDADALNAQVEKLYGAGKYAEAIPIAQRALALREKALGPDHPNVGESLNNLAAMYRAQSRYAEAEPLHKRALVLREKALGPDHPDVGESLNNLAGLYYALGRFTEAEPLMKRALAINEKALGPDHPNVGWSLNNLGEMYKAQGRYAEAQPLYKRSLAINEKALGPDHPWVAAALSNLAGLYHDQGRYPEAEPLMKRALVLREKALGPDHPDVSSSLSSLAGLYFVQGRYAEAEPLYKRALAISEKALGPDHPDVGWSLNSLAVVYHAQGRYPEAEPLMKRALVLREKALGPDHPDVSSSLSSLAGLYFVQGRYAEAEPLYKRALAISEKALGPDHPKVGASLNSLAEVYYAQGRYPEAEPLMKRALVLREKALGPDHPEVGASLNNLALLYRAQSRYAEAEPLYKRDLAINEKALGPDHPNVGTSLYNLAILALAQRDLAGAADAWRRAVAVLQRRAERGLGRASGGSSTGEAQRKHLYFAGLVKTTHRLATTTVSDLSLAPTSGGTGLTLSAGRNLESDRQVLTAEMFEIAQWGQVSEAAASLAQMAVRSATGSLALAALVRERQDLIAEWSANDKQLIAARSEPPARRNAAGEKALADRLATIDARFAAIDATLAKEFPDYAALASPKSSPVAEVQGSLREDEALVLFLDTAANWAPILPEETFVWVVTRTDVRWVRSELGTKSLAREVAALRCGLDATAWDGEGGRNCAKLLKLSSAESPLPLPFDQARAQALYKSLFSEVENLIKNKHLLLVPSGALTALPFQVLVTDPSAKPGDWASVAWLAKRHALTVLPSVASLKALRSNAKASAAPEPFIAFADPMLSRKCGPVTIPEKCPESEVQLATAGISTTRAIGKVDVTGSYFRGGLADVAALNSRLCPLPDTAFEVSCVAKSLGADARSLVLGRDMTETAVKTAPLDRYRVVHFATHGLLAGETSQLARDRAEPALVFSPPNTPTEADDGLLTASEVAALKLDADWVVMSACNTAGGGEPGAEALSGLAKAFFYAGARALLVSHWPVDSYAATMLTSRTFAELMRDPRIGRSEAFRSAMLALMSDDKRPWAAHPSVWAPFIVVGEGGAEK